MTLDGGSYGALPSHVRAVFQCLGELAHFDGLCHGSSRHDWKAFGAGPTFTDPLGVVATFSLVERQPSRSFTK